MVETKLPLGRKAIESRWVFAIKRDALGNIIKYKARLIAKSYPSITRCDHCKAKGHTNCMTFLQKDAKEE